MLDNSSLITVIVPIFNAEGYIKRCVDSILVQSYKYFELILINDGSEDNSLNIINALALQDSRIKVINQKNMGVSYARNNGINEATGLFISFVDSDDLLESDYLKKMHDTIVEYNSDIIISNTIVSNEKSQKIYRNSFPKNILLDKNYVQKEILQNLVKSEELFAVWNKLYKRDIILENSIKFPIELKREEDQIFNLVYFSHCKSAFFLDDQGYIYIEREGSVSRNENILNSFLLSYEKFKLDYNNYFKISEILSNDQIQNLKSIRFVNKSHYLYFHMSFSQYDFNSRCETIRGFLNNELLMELHKKGYIRENTNGIFGKVIFYLFKTKSLFLLLIFSYIIQLHWCPVKK